MVITHLRLVRLSQDLASLNPSAKIKFRTGSKPMLCIPVDDCPSYCATAIGQLLSFAPFKNAWKKQISSEKASKSYCMGDLHLQLPSIDLHLEFGTGKVSNTICTDGGNEKKSITVVIFACQYEMFI